MTTQFQRQSKPRWRHGSRAKWLLLLGVVTAAIAGVAWTQLRPRVERDDPNVLVNLTTMVGRQAPEFVLATAEGETYNITPGDGRKILLIFHMGSV